MAYMGNHPLPEDIKRNPHVQHLLAEHEQIEETIRQERAHAWVREDLIKSLKLKQLGVMERIEAARQQRH
jgi:hypothetical protein